jgi:hypothetical protein
MSRERIETVRAIYERWSAGDFGAGVDLFDENTLLILHADHELNASTFAARVTAATLADMYAAIVSAIKEVFDLRPAAIIRDLDLKRPIYAKTAAYGHFGRELPEFTWERLDRVDALRQAAGA